MMGGIPWRPGRTSLALCATAVVLACAPAEAPSPLPFAVAVFHDDCAPWDGAALTLVFGSRDVARPHELPNPGLRVSSFRPPAVLAGGSFEWEGTDHDLGTATWCEGDGTCQAPSALRVRFDRTRGPADTLSGELWLELVPDRTIAGRFSARRLPFEALCG